MRFVLSLIAILAAFLLLRSLLEPLVKALANWLNPPPPAPPEGVSSARSAELKKDPVCGVFVSPDVAVVENRKGQTLHFCSKKCRDEYLRSG